ncbi:MAG: hypothetical protein H7A09_01935 [Oceanospirillaceae bacterium]|nr:hypothetical protein [Oceanospirillaceae bacterium]MCP5334553.1 hypothetical protein [Oceanospirillaceae bacterium]
MSQVLFVSHSKREDRYYYDASARYRCIFPAEYLNSTGIIAHVVHVNDLHKIDLQPYSHLIAHRPQDDRRLRRYLKKARALGIECIADFDDLLFRPELADESPAVQSGAMDLRSAQNQHRAYLKALRQFRHCWVSTDHLEIHAEQAVPDLNVNVCYNLMSTRWTALADMLPAGERLQNKVIRYMPGTAHHSHDFARIQTALASILNNHADIRLEVVGDMAIDANTFPADQFARLPFVAYDALPQLIASSWLTIAPLEDTEFNRCKSGLKFWESGIFGVPVISSSLPDIERFSNAGLLIGGPEKWPQFIDQLCSAEVYCASSDAAYIQAKNAVFSPATDIRAALLGLTTKAYKPALSTAQIRNQHIYMCAHFGPRWLADSLNPASKDFQTINALQPAALPQGCKDTADIRIKNDLHYKNRSAGRRKIRKLLRNPRLFFIDMLKKMSQRMSRSNRR